ncbi:MAG: hypothetical protein ACRDH9_11645 [Actinomycetota bacterium]
MDLKKETSSAGGLKKPTGRDYLVFYGVAVAGALGLGALALALDWSRLTFLASGFAWLGVSGPIAVIWLHTRRETPRPAHS